VVQTAVAAKAVINKALFQHSAGGMGRHLTFKPEVSLCNPRNKDFKKSTGKDVRAYPTKHDPLDKNGWNSKLVT
jgi:hypothetical protein